MSVYHLLNNTHTHTHTHTQPFYGSLNFVWDNPGEYQKKHLPTHIYRDHQSSFTSFIQCNIFCPLLFLLVPLNFGSFDVAIYMPVMWFAVFFFLNYLGCEANHLSHVNPENVH